MSVRSEVIRIFNELVGSGKKITELPAATTPLAGTELLEIVQSGTNKRITASSLSSGGTGIESIVAGDNITIDNSDPQNPIVSASSSGTVTSVSAGNLSPLFTASVATATTTPAITFAQVTQGANLVFAGPGTGADANPTFRSLVAADMPDLSSVYQPIDGDLTAIAALGFAAESFLKKTAADTWVLDTNTYLPIIGGTLTGYLFLHADPTQLFHAATKQYVDNTVNSAVTGLWDDRGTFDASGGAYPSSGGSGTAGAILKGDIWTISVAGTLPTGQVVEVGDTVRSLIDTPGNTQANWAIAQNNIGYTPLTNTLTSAQIFVGNGSNVATGVALTGDIAITNTGVTSYAGTVPVNKGGTNITSYAVGDLVYASGTTTLSKLAAVATGSVLGSAGTTTAPAYLAVSNGLTATATTFKLGGALTADTSISGTFSLSFAGGASGAGATVYTFTPTLTATANSQTQYGADINLIPVDGAFTGLTRSFMRMRSNSSATNTYDFGASTFTTTGLTSADLNGGSMRLRNTTGPFNIQGGSGSTDCIRFSGVFTNSTDNHIAFRFTNGGSANSTALHTAGTAITRTWNAIVYDWTVSSVNGSTITYIIDKVIPTFSLGNSTATITGYDYNPDLSASSGTITHYAMLIRSGNVGIADNTPTEKLSVAGNIKLNTAGNGLLIKEGTNATMGVATLVAGTVVVNTTKVTANSRIFLTGQNLGTITVPVGYAVSARTAGTSFTILSANVVDTSSVGWWIAEPA